MEVDIFILNYNGVDYLEETVQSFLEAIRVSKNSCRLAVIDNQSTDNSVSLIRNKFPDLEIIIPDQNKVLCSFNSVVKERSSAEIVFLMNNDLVVEKDFIDPMVEIFREHDDAFLVAPKSFLRNQEYEGGLCIPFFKLGMFGTTCHFQGYKNRIDQIGLTFQAGYGAFHRQRFIELGGYDDLYLPGRMEDSDLAFRAWKMGWKGYYQPKSIVYHIGAKAFKDRFGERKTMEIAHRNTYLFMWKNIRGIQYLFLHFLFFFPRLIWMILKGRYEMVTGFIGALARLDVVLSKRRAEKVKFYPINEQQVISVFRHAH